MSYVKIFVMMAGLTALLAGLGWYFGGSQGAWIFFFFAAAMNFGMYWFSDKVVLKMYKARIIGPEDASELYAMVDRLRQRAGLPMPTVAVAPQEQPNAFATGRNWNHAVVCCTAGILKLLPPDELEGVIAHELAHIQHRHMLVGTLAATMAGAIAMISRLGFFFGGSRNRGHPAMGLIMLIVGPLAAMIIQFAISRQNEYQADRTGGEIAGDPTTLARALERMDSYAKQIPMDVNPAAAQLAIVNPLASRARGGIALGGLFRTHPPTEERVARLRQQAREIGGSPETGGGRSR